MGWIRKAQPGLFILQKVVSYTQADLPELLRELLTELR
jgi:hypothetical protein